MEFFDNHKEILIVDDEESILNVLKIGLTNSGYNVTCAEYVREAKVFIKEKKFDYAIIDIRLHDGNGIELSKFIRKELPEIIIVLMTGFPGIKSAVDALRQHVYDYLIKPFRIEQLTAVLERSQNDLAMTREKQYYQEIIRSLKEDNKRLKTMLSTFMIDDTNTGKRLYKNLSSGTMSKEDMMLKSYSHHLGNKTKKKNIDDNDGIDEHH